MNALTLAEYLDRHVHIAAMHDECANKLRRQHEAIVKLRSALRMLNGIASTYPCSLHQKHSSVVDAEQALKDTEDLK